MTNSTATGPFVKMQGIGNDFVVLEPRHWPDTDWPSLSMGICDRRAGVGADGLLLVDQEEPGRYRMRMFNPDGTEDDCGNGLRCVVRYIRSALAGEDRMTIRTLSGLHQAEVLAKGPGWSRIRVTMPPPLLRPEEIPMIAPGPVVIDYPIDTGTGKRAFTCVFTGSTHAITFLDRPVDEEVFRTESPRIERHRIFLERTSVLWAWPDGPDRYRVRIWERGVGATLGCGTGACAVAVAARLRGAAGGPVTVTSAGGELEIDWDGDGEIRMTGPAVTVFEGEWPRR